VEVLPLVRSRNLMKCTICKERDATPDAEVCEDMNCIKAYLASGRGSISGNPYKTFMRHCGKAVEQNTDEDNE